MKLPLYQIDAFAEQPFQGNPAAVCPLTEWLADRVMQNIAMENNLSETAFFVEQSGRFQLRWFTPTAEVDLCGHATLASAHVLFECLGYNEDTIRFDTNSGELNVRKKGDQLVMDFPSATLKKTSKPNRLEEALGISVKEIFLGNTDYLCILDSEEQVRHLQPNISVLKSIEARGIIVTAPGKDTDFVSRFFAPAVGVDEDPVTGSAHTVLTPYWSKRLGKTALVARQISARGGTVYCIDKGRRVELSGNAITFMKGEIMV